jgi:Zn-dependent protease with chaperone function
LRDYAAESILHAFVAAAVVEALTRVWRLRDPDARLRLRLVGLVLPLLTPGLFSLLSAGRSDPAFHARALFVSARWHALEIGGVAVPVALLWCAAALGLVLIARDLIALLADRSTMARGVEAVPPEVEAMAARIAGSLGIAPPRLVASPTDTIACECRGGSRASVALSRGALSLPHDELRAAIAHELAHVAARDVSFGRVLLALRTVAWWNPVSQVLGRAVLHDLEARADRTASRATGDPLALARVLARLRAETAAPGVMRASTRGGSWRGRIDRQPLLERAAALRQPIAPAPDPVAPVRLASAAAGLCWLLYFVA